MKSNGWIIYGNSIYDITIAVEKAVKKISENSSYTFKVSADRFKQNQDEVIHILENIDTELKYQSFEDNSKDLLLVIENIEQFNTPRNGDAFDLIACLEKLIQNSSNRLKIIFTCYIKELKKLPKPWHRLIKLCHLTKTTPSYTSLNIWLKGLARKKHDLDLSTDLCELIIEKIGFDKIKLDKEIYKLKLLKQIGEKVNKTAIEELISFQNDILAFKLSEVILNCDTKNLLTTLNDQDFYTPANSVRASTTISNNLILIYTLKLYQKSGIDLNTISNNFAMPFWLLNKNWNLAAKISIQALEDMLLNLGNIDLPVKFLNKLGMEILLFKLLTITKRMHKNLRLRKLWIP